MLYLIGFIGLVATVVLVLWLAGFRIIPNNKIGVVEKWWSTKGTLYEQIIALNGESGDQPKRSLGPFCLWKIIII